MVLGIPSAPRWGAGSATRPLLPISPSFCAPVVADWGQQYWHPGGGPPRRTGPAIWHRAGPAPRGRCGGHPHRLHRLGPGYDRRTIVYAVGFVLLSPAFPCRTTASFSRARPDGPDATVSATNRAVGLLLAPHRAGSGPRPGRVVVVGPSPDRRPWGGYRPPPPGGHRSPGSRTDRGGDPVGNRHPHHDPGDQRPAAHRCHPPPLVPGTPSAGTGRQRASWGPCSLLAHPERRLSRLSRRLRRGAFREMETGSAADDLAGGLAAVGTWLSSTWRSAWSTERERSLAGAILSPSVWPCSGLHRRSGTAPTAPDGPPPLGAQDRRGRPGTVLEFLLIRHFQQTRGNGGMGWWPPSCRARWWSSLGCVPDATGNGGSPSSPPVARRSRHWSPRSPRRSCRSFLPGWAFHSASRSSPLCSWMTGLRSRSQDLREMPPLFRRREPRSGATSAVGGGPPPAPMGANSLWIEPGRRPIAIGRSDLALRPRAEEAVGGGALKKRSVHRHEGRGSC
jgi:hypothetical protein